MSVELSDFVKQRIPPGKVACQNCANEGGRWVSTPDGDADFDPCATCEGAGHVDLKTAMESWYFCAECEVMHFVGQAAFNLHREYQFE